MRQTPARKHTRIFFCTLFGIGDDQPFEVMFHLMESKWQLSKRLGAIGWLFFITVLASHRHTQSKTRRLDLWR